MRTKLQCGAQKRPLPPLLVSLSRTRSQVSLGAVYQEEGSGAIGEGEEAGHIPAGATAGCQVPWVVILLVLKARAEKTISVSCPHPSSAVIRHAGLPCLPEAPFPPTLRPSPREQGGALQRQHCSVGNGGSLVPDRPQFESQSLLCF